MRQRCDLRPRLFIEVLESALRQWRIEMGNAGLHLGDTLDNLVDLRFLDDILLFPSFGLEVARFFG